MRINRMLLKFDDIILIEVKDSAAAPIEKVEVKGSGLPDSKQFTKLAILGMCLS